MESNDDWDVSVVQLIPRGATEGQPWCKGKTYRQTDVVSGHVCSEIRGRVRVTRSFG